MTPTWQCVCGLWNFKGSERCRICTRPERKPSMTPTNPEFPDRIVVGANGAYWRDYGDGYSMCPVSEDNDPVVVVATYVRSMTPTPDPLREALQSLIDVIGTGGLVGTSAAIMDLGDAVIAVQFALAQPGPALDVERLAPFLAIEFGKAGFFAPTASMEFLHAQATMMLADAVAEYASRETLDVP